MSSIVECCQEGKGGQTLSTFYSTRNSDLELNILRMYYLMNNSFMECFVKYLTNSNRICVRSTTLDDFALDQTSLDKKRSSGLHSTRWPNALDISLSMHVKRCIALGQGLICNFPMILCKTNQQYLDSILYVVLTVHCCKLLNVKCVD